MLDTPPTDLLPVVQADELQPPRTEGLWLVEHLWLEQGVGILGGAPKLGKTWLGLDLALSVASRTPCLGRFAVPRPGSVLCYLAEDAPHLVRARLEGLCQTRRLYLSDLPIQVITAPTLRLDREHDRHRLHETVRHFSPRLLLLDPFVRLHGIDENDAGAVSRTLAFLRGLQREFELAICVVHHARKNGPGGAQVGMALRGSVDFFAWSDSLLFLQRRPEHLVLTIEHRAAPPPSPLHLTLASDPAPYLELVDDPSDATDSSLFDLEPRILEVLAASPYQPVPRPELRRLLHVRNQRLGQALVSLADSGRIQRKSTGWALSSASRIVPDSHP
jgi:hypothetical protein